MFRCHDRGKTGKPSKAGVSGGGGNGGGSGSGLGADRRHYRVGWWLSSRKARKLNIDALASKCWKNHIELVEIKLDEDLEDQRPLDAIVHKLSDFVVLADRGDQAAEGIISNFEKFHSHHPRVLMFDPLPCIRRICDRYQQYLMLKEICAEGQIETPAFVHFDSDDVVENLTVLRASSVSFPLVCKALAAHGSAKAHQMSLIFGEHALNDIKPPCVVQSFIPHDSVLYKVFVMGNDYFISARPSLKNFVKGPFPTISFDSQQVSKIGCVSTLTTPVDSANYHCKQLDDDIVSNAVKLFRRKTGLSLFGIDIIVQKDTGCLYVIDVNTFPSYEGVPNFLDLLCSFLSNELTSSTHHSAASCSPTTARAVSSSQGGSAAALVSPSSSSPVATAVQTDSGIGSCTESESSDCERKMKHMKLHSVEFRRCLSEMSVAEHATNRIVYEPDVNRIKKYYGIPKTVKSWNTLS